jgi:hypothetical protein
VGEKGKDRGLLAKLPSPSSHRFRTEGGGSGRPAGRLRRLPAPRGSTTAGNRGKRERGTRAIHSGAHLGRGLLEEGGSAAMAAGGRGCWRRRGWWRWRCK